MYWILVTGCFYDKLGKIVVKCQGEVWWLLELLKWWQHMVNSYFIEVIHFADYHLIWRAVC